MTTYTTNNSNTITNGATVGGTITITGSGGSGSGYSGYTSSGYTIGTGIGGTSGQIYTTTGAGSAYWAASPTFTNGNGKALLSMPSSKDEVVLSEEASLVVKGKVIINEIDLDERLRTIEKVLQIPERDVKLEKKYPKLKQMYDEYIAALGKYRTFEAIKGEDEKDIL